MEYFCQRIKIHIRVSVAKKDVLYISVLFTGTAKLLFSAPGISIITGLICIKFTYFMPSIYMILHTKFGSIFLHVFLLYVLF